MRRALVAMLGALSCARPVPPPVQPQPRPAPPVASTTLPAAPLSEPSWPEPLAAALVPHGKPHVEPIALPRDGRGSDRWLAFVGSSGVAVGAWRVTRQPTGETTAGPVEHWPVGVRVLGGTVRDGVAYVLLESLGVLDQPAGMRAVWVDAWGVPSPYDASPLALGSVRDVADLDDRLHAPPRPPSEQSAAALLGALHSASASGASLVRSLAAAGADVGVAWQSLFVQTTGHLDANTIPSAALVDHVLAITRSALSTQACGADACEAWTDHGHAVVRFALEDGRWALRLVAEDAPASKSREGTSRHIVEASADATTTAALLASRGRNVGQVLGEARLTAAGGTIGVGFADVAPDVPIVVVSEGDASRIFPLPVGGTRAATTEPRWDAAFADVDGDGRTDVVVHMSGRRAGPETASWVQTFLAPPPSVQASSLEADLPSALVVMDAPDAAAAARAAVALPARSVTREDACHVLTAASIPAGFRRVASADARLLLFQEPGMPTWRPRVVPAARVAADQASALAAHCAELTCSATRPYCGWSAGANSLHAWFDWRDEHLQLVGAADYDGE